MTTDQVPIEIPTRAALDGPDEILLAESGDRVDRAFEQPDLDGPLDHLAA